MKKIGVLKHSIVRSMTAKTFPVEFRGWTVHSDTCVRKIRENLTMAQLCYQAED